MKNFALFAFLIVVLFGTWACTPNRGCIEATADNFDAAAEENDGTCIASRDKMIGSYRYTRIWNDVILAIDTVDVGIVTITEANTAGNAFNMNLNGNLFLQGASSAYTLVIIQRAYTDTFSGMNYNHTYNGSGTWLVNDTVDFIFTINTQVPMLNGANPPGIATVPQVYNYYCTKTQ